MLDGVVMASVGLVMLDMDVLDVRSEDNWWQFLSNVEQNRTGGGSNGQRGSSPHSVNYCVILSVRGGVGSSVASHKCGCGRL